MQHKKIALSFAQIDLELNFSIGLVHIASGFLRDLQKSILDPNLHYIHKLTEMWLEWSY